MEARSIVVSPSPKHTGVPRMGDVATLAARTDRLDRVEDAILRIERKVDHLIEIMLPPAKAKR